jgi:hypothetical protein
LATRPRLKIRLAVTATFRADEAKGSRYTEHWHPEEDHRRGLLSAAGFNFFGVWDPLYHAALNDARFADREVGVAP